MSYLVQVAPAEALSGCMLNNRLRVGIVKRILGQLSEKTWVSEKTARNHSAAIKRWLLGAKNVKMAADYELIDLALERANAVLEEAEIIECEVEC